MTRRISVYVFFALFLLNYSCAKCQESDSKIYEVDYFRMQFDFASKQILVNKKGKEWVYLKIIDAKSGIVMTQKLMIRERTHKLAAIFQQGQCVKIETKILTAKDLLKQKYLAAKNKVARLLSPSKAADESANEFEGTEAEAQAQKISWSKTIDENICL